MHNHPTKAPAGSALRSMANDPALHLQALVVLSVALGGGGVAYGLRNLVVQWAALALLALHGGHVWRFLRDGPRLLVALVLASMALPLLQLVPLPANLWQAMPGRDLASAAYALAGLPAQSWAPLSLDQGRTLVAFCGTLAPAAIIAIGTGLSPADKARIVWAVAAAAAGSALLGFVQLSTANTMGLLFPMTPKADVLYATFANRNSTAALMALAMALLVALPLPRGQGWQLGAGGVGVLLLLAAILTKSRSGMVLMALALGFVVLRLGFAAWSRQRRAPQAPGIRGALALVLAGLAVAGIGAAALGSDRVSDSLARLGDAQSDRPLIWDDATYAAGVYWPVGSGMGTFDEVFQLHESLENLSPRRAGRAHSDWLEITIEAGLAGALLALGWLVWCLVAALRAPMAERWPALAAGLGAGMLALQSLLDYPLRNQALLCVAAVLILFLARLRNQAR